MKKSPKTLYTEFLHGKAPSDPATGFDVRESAPPTLTRNQKYYLANREAEKARALEYYAANKHKIDREAKKAYCREYYKTHPNKPPTQEQRDKRNAARRERYATDQEYAEKEKADVKAWQRKNPHIRKAQRLRVAFGITLAQFNSMMASQDGKCAICGGDSLNKKIFPMVDHDHRTGAVRGLLCMNCNQGIGKFKDNPDLLLSAIYYLERSAMKVAA